MVGRQVVIIFQAIHGIASISPSAAMQTLSQLQYLFQEPGLFRFLADRIDAVVQAVVTQTSLIRSRHLNDFSLLEEVNDLIRLINNFLCSVSSCMPVLSNIYFTFLPSLGIFYFRWYENILHVDVLQQKT